MRKTNLADQQRRLPVVAVHAGGVEGAGRAAAIGTTKAAAGGGGARNPRASGNERPRAGVPGW